MKLKKVLAVALSSAMVLSLAACGSSSSSASGSASAEGETTFEEMTWSASTAGAEGSNFTYALEVFADLINEKTNGAVTVEIYPSDQLTNGNQVDSVQGCIDGTVDIAFEADGVWGNFDQEFCVPNLPFIFSTFDDVDEKLLNGEAGQVLLDKLESDYNVKGLGIGENGFRYITNNKHAIETPEDFKGLKFRVGGSPLLTSCYTAWGVDYTTASWSEVYTGIQTGLYDGQENPVAVVDASSIQELQNYCTVWTCTYSSMFLTMNLDLYNSLPEELQAIVDECGKEACAQQVQYTRDQTDSILQNWQDEYGIEVYEMTQENQDKFAELVEFTYDDYAEYQDVIDLIK